MKKVVIGVAIVLFIGITGFLVNKAVVLQGEVFTAIEKAKEQPVIDEQQTSQKESEKAPKEEPASPLTKEQEVYWTEMEKYFATWEPALENYYEESSKEDNSATGFADWEKSVYALEAVLKTKESIPVPPEQEYKDLHAKFISVMKMHDEYLKALKYAVYEASDAEYDKSYDLVHVMGAQNEEVLMEFLTKYDEMYNRVHAN